jgi:hypothetical protein
MKILIISFICFATAFYAQKHTSRNVKEVKCYNIKTSKKGVLESKLYYRNDNQLEKIEHYNTFGEITQVTQYEYDSLNRCVLSYKFNGLIYFDTTRSVQDKQGNLVQLRQATFRNFDLNKSKFNKIKYNKCGDPVKITKYQEPFKIGIISKYKYDYLYW